VHSISDPTTSQTIAPAAPMLAREGPDAELRLPGNGAIKVGNGAAASTTARQSTVSGKVIDFADRSDR
jgi:hypothetical protein